MDLRRFFVNPYSLAYTQISTVSDKDSRKILIPLGKKRRIAEKVVLGKGTQKSFVCTAEGVLVSRSSGEVC